MCQKLTKEEQQNLNYRQWSSKKTTTLKKGPVFTLTESQPVKDWIVKTTSSFYMHQITCAQFVIIEGSDFHMANTTIQILELSGTQVSLWACLH